jgi:Zn-dependent protease/predicted transcriptional regulator
MNGGLKIGRWFGIQVSIDVSWLVIATLVSWSFYAIYTDRFPDLTTGEAITFGVGAAILFFVSVLLHELSHSLMARRLGIPVSGITLFIFGGVTTTEQEAESPGQEFAIAVVGPLTSIALGGVCWVLVNMTGGLLSEPVRFGIGYLGWLNLALGVFNMLPGFPLDGGRVLRSILWKATGSLTRSTQGAARGGRILASLLIGFGVFVLFAGNLVGLWYAAIGWFLYQAAAGAGREVMIRHVLSGVTASDLMSPDPVVIPGGISLRDAVDDFFLRYDHSAFPVRDEEDDSTVGILTLRAVRQVPRDQWDVRQVWAAMTRLEDACTVEGDTPMSDVVERLRDQDHERVLVVDGDTVVGIITAADVSRWVRRSNELGLTPSDGRAESQPRP